MPLASAVLLTVTVLPVAASLVLNVAAPVAVTVSPLMKPAGAMASVAAAVVLPS